jgi:adenylylsulfate kinase
MSVKRPYTIWLMGPTSSGKSTIAENFASTLKGNDIPILHYDGDEVRSFFGKNFGFSENNRGHVVETIVYLAKKANDAGVNVVVSALTAHQSSRDHVKESIPNLYIGYVDCPIDVCIARDPKGLYAKAINKEIDTLIGYNTKYQPPNEPDIKLDANKFSVEENTDCLLRFLKAPYR